MRSNPDLTATMLRTTLRRTFTPSTPMDDPDLFRGREEELRRARHACDEQGQHGIVFGDRGVGKTSLANIAKEIFLTDRAGIAIGLRLQCSADDDFDKLWRKLPQELENAVERLDSVSDARKREMLTLCAELLLTDLITPNSVRVVLKKISDTVPTLIIIDEFDRLQGAKDAEKCADLIKMLSDDRSDCTILIVGVADDIDGLIDAHNSVERCLRQIPMRNMTETEIRSIVTEGFQTFSERTGYRISVEGRAVIAVSRLAQGFPYYAHLICSTMGLAIITDNRHRIKQEDVLSSLLQATDEASQSIKSSYLDAITSPRKDATFNLTLLASAMASTDQLGYFAPSDISRHLTDISGSLRRTPQYISHLKRFSNGDRPILTTRGEGRMTRYRFRDPLMKPFIIIQGVRTGVLALPAKDS